MDKIKTPPNAQKKYRQSQSHKGLVRFELQVDEAAKTRFEEMVRVAAEEYEEPWDLRQRLAKARVKIFDEITQGCLHEFSGLKKQIQALKQEIAALSPNFFQSDLTDTTPLPEAIRTLPDDPQPLKALLAKTHREKQKFQQTSEQYQRSAKQYRELYEVSSAYNEELQSRLKENDEFVEG